MWVAPGGTLTGKFSGEARFLYTPYLEGQGDLVSRLLTPITHLVTLLIPPINPSSPFLDRSGKGLTR